MSTANSARSGVRGQTRRRLLAPLGLLAGLLLAGLALAGPASAHATLVSSSPEDGAEVTTEPASVQLRFDEVIGLIPSAEQVISTTGARADTGAVHVINAGTTIDLPLKPNLPNGTYSATWRVVSADTHIVSGSITFGIGVRPGAGVAGPVDHTRALAVTDQIAQGLVYAGAVLLVGLLAVTRLLWPWAARQRRIAAAAGAGWAALLAGSVLQFLLQGPRAANGSWPAFLDLDGFSQTLHSTYGTQLIARAALLVLVVALLLAGNPRRDRDEVHGPAPTRWLIDALAGLAVLVSIAVTGHEAVGADVPLALPAAVLHLAGMAVWLGGLVALGIAVLPALRHGRLDLDRARLHRWSVLAYSCVVLLVVTGEYQASRQISPIQALWSTRYGIILLIKTGLVAVMLIAAYLTQRRLGPTSAPAASEPSAAPPGHETSGIETPSPARQSLRGATATLTSATPVTKTAPARVAARRVGRSVAVEAAAAALVLAVTAVLVSQAPARTTYGPAVTLDAPLGPDHAAVHINTTRRGPQTLTIRILDAADKPIGSQTLTASLSSTNVAALTLTMTKTSTDGSEWISHNTIAPLPGMWTLDLDIGLSSDDAYSTSTAYRVW